MGISLTGLFTHVHCSSIWMWSCENSGVQWPSAKKCFIKEHMWRGTQSHTAPPPPPHFLCYSYRFRCLFYSNGSALRSGHHRIFRHDSSSKRMYSIYSIQSALKCARRELKLYIFTEVYDVTLVRAWRCCAAQIHEWMFRNKVNFSGFPLLRE